MSDTPEKRARAETILGELAEHALVVAKELAIRMRETEDADQAVAFADAFHKVSRVVRLTIALDFKLDRDAARDAREQARETDRICAGMEADLPPPDASPQAKAAACQVRVRKLANRLIWSESEGDGPEYDLLFQELDARMERAVLAEETKHLPIETLARRIAADLGLSGHPALADFEGRVCSELRQPRPRPPVSSAPAKKSPQNPLNRAGPEPRPDG